MTLGETIGALAHLPDDAQITVTIRKGDLARALEIRGGGPATITTAEAAAACGYPADRWRRWAEAGRIAGAWQDAPGAPWRLPRAACEEHVRALQSAAARRPSSDAPPASTPRRRPPSPRPARSQSRGPRTPSPAPAAHTRGATGPRARRGSAGAVVLPLAGAHAQAET